MNAKRKPLYPDTPRLRYVPPVPSEEVDPRATANYERFMACHDVPKRRVWAVGRFLRDMKQWATEWRAQ